MYTKQKKILQNAIKVLQLQTMLKRQRTPFLIATIFIKFWTFGSLGLAQSTETNSDAASPQPTHVEAATKNQGLDSNSIFQAAVAAYKKHNLDEARQLFSQFLSKASSSEALYDLGLVEYDAKNIGTAVALWRKATEIDPNNQLAHESLNFIQKRIEHPELNRQNDSFEVLREKVLNHTRIEYLFLLSAFILGAFLWLLVSYLGERKRSREQELPGPPIPWIASILFCIFILSGLVSSSKLYDLNIPRATVLPAKISVLSAPDAESTQLFELFEGLEVVVESSQGDYFQVTFPGGMTGWTLKKNLMLTSGRNI